MKADAMNFSLAIFEMSKIDSRFVSRAQRHSLTAISVVFGKSGYATEFCFGISKIAEEKVQNVSFHNHLVARCHIKN